MKKQKLKFHFKLIIPVIVVLFLSAAVGYMLKMAARADYFKVKEVIFSEQNSASLSYLKNESIFAVDLNKEAHFLLQKFPDYKKIRLIRVFPDRLYVDFVKRIPLAYVRLYRPFYVDSDAVLFNAPQLTPDAGMPVIIGLDTKIFGPKSGSRYNIKELTTALEIIRQIKNNRLFRAYQLKKIDVASLGNAAFFLSFGLPASAEDAAGGNHENPGLLEVKIGSDNIRDKINILASLLSQVNNEKFNIKYIDLRFKEPVIKLDNTEGIQRR